MSSQVNSKAGSDERFKCCSSKFNSPKSVGLLVAFSHLTSGVYYPRLKYILLAIRSATDAKPSSEDLKVT